MDNLNNKSNISPSDLAMIRSMIAMNPLTLSAIAALIKVNKGTIASAIDGKRILSSTYIYSLLDKIGLDGQFELKKNMTHIFEIGVDISPIIPVISRFSGASLWWINPPLNWSNINPDDKSFKSYFVIKSIDDDLIVVDRDPWRVSRGNASAFMPDYAPAFSPENLEGLVSWGAGSAKDSRLDLSFSEIDLYMSQLKDGERYLSRADAINFIFNESAEKNNEASWEDVIKQASLLGYTPEDTMNLIHHTNSLKFR